MTLPYKVLLERSTDKLNNDILPQLTFIHPLTEALKCYHCNKILQRPQQLSCGHRICLKCVNNFMAESPRRENNVRYCAEDDEDLEEDTFPDVSALKEVFYLTCYCLRKDDGCPWQGDIKDIEQHLTLCTFNVQIECRFKEFGCTFEGTTNQLKVHMKDSEANHHAIVTTTIAQVKHNTKNTRQLIDGFRKKEKRVTDSLQILQKDLVDLKQAIPDIENCSKNVNEHFDGRIERLKENKDKMLELQKKLMEEMKKAENLTELVESSTNGGLSYEEQIETLNQKLGRLNVTHKENQDQMKQIELKTKLFQSTTFNGKFIWKLDNLEKRYLDAVAGKVTELLTPPLYTSRYGYKFCAKLLLNGDAKPGERSQHIAIYIIIMRGDFDEILTWPFRNLVKITLLNMDERKQGIERVLIPRLELPHFMKPVKDMNNAIGFPRFCSQDSLYSEGYVRDDSLFIKIEVESATAEL